MAKTNNYVKELKIERTFDAPLEQVWKAWTDGKIVAKWWGPMGFTNPTCNVDPRVGGEIYIVMMDSAGLIKKGSKYPMRGKFTEVNDGESLVFTNNAIDEKGNPLIESLTTVKFEKTGGKTKVTLHTGVIKFQPQMQMALDGMDMGWNQQMDKFEEFLAR